MSDKIFIAKQKEIFTVKEAAEYLTVCPRTVYALIESRELEAIKIGCRYKIKAEALIKFIDNREER